MVDIMELFLNHNGDDTVKNSHDFTCLHIAAKEGYVELCQLLIEKGKDPEAESVDKYGFSASYWAKENGHIAILKILPAVKKMTKEEYFNKIAEVWAKEGKPGGKKKGGKKKGGKKKKWSIKKTHISISSFIDSITVWRKIIDLIIGQIF